VEAANIRFPALEDVRVRLWSDLTDSQGFTDARRAPILAKLCTFTFVTKLVLYGNDIAVVPDAIGALTNLKELDLSFNKIATLPASIGRLAALEKLNLDDNILTAVPASIGSLTALTTLWLH
jgi:Leucine-rich repeat (LRR) protein